MMLCIAFFSLLLMPDSARADGTEELGPPEGITVAKGSGMVAAGIGVSTTLPVVIAVTVPTTSTVEQVLLYWSGGMVDNNPGNDSITINGETVTGSNIGGPTFFFTETNDAVYFSAFRADITDLGVVQPGTNMISVESQPFSRERDGVGVLVIYDDGSGDARIEIRDGMDLAFFRFPEPRQTVDAQTFTFPPSTEERIGRMSMFFGSVAPGEERSSTITITVDSNPVVVGSNLLGSDDGPQWDTVNIDFFIPSGSTSVMVDAVSTPIEDPLGASFSWIASSFFLLDPVQGGIELEKLTNGFDADNANGTDVPLLTVGDTVTWTYLVTNTGSITFTEANVVVTDSHSSVTPQLVTSSDDGSDQLLSPGESWTYLATGIVEDLANPSDTITVVNGCSSTTGGGSNAYENVGQVTVPDAVDSDPSHYCTSAPEPSIVLEKLTGGVGPNNTVVDPADADDANGADVPVLAIGQVVTWTYIVTNTGAISLTEANVVLTDSHSTVMPQLVTSSDVGSDQLLSPGESWTYVATGTVEDLTNPAANTTVVDGCSASTGTEDRAYENVGQVTIPGATDSDPSHYCIPNLNPDIVLEKLTSGVGPSGAVVDPADADDANGSDVPVLAMGQVVTWTYVVTNTGNVPFAEADVVVTDSHTSVTPVFDVSSDNGDRILWPGESWIYRATGTVADLTNPDANTTVVNGCGSSTGTESSAYENIGSVTVPGATDNDPSHYCIPTMDPGIDIEKLTGGDGATPGITVDPTDADDANGTDVPILRIGGSVTWNYVVNNTGNVPFTEAEINVTDSDAGVTPSLDTSSDDGDQVLSPGESWTYVATGTVVDLISATVNGSDIVNGCAPTASDLNPNPKAYENIGTVAVPGANDTDPSHYCNPPPNSLDTPEEPEEDADLDRYFYVPFLIGHGDVIQ